MLRLSETKQGIDWVSQFRTEHQQLACSLLDAISLIPHDDLVLEIRSLIHEVAQNTNGTIALFAEREVKRGKGKIPHALYKQPRRKKNRRASGAGPQPVRPKHDFDLTVGSEGIVAWLVSDICKQHPKQFISHPSPAQVRESEVRNFVVVTDMIGSGQRVCEYLDSMWKVASVKSWKSYGLISFSVVSFSGTDHGISRTRKHRAKPHVSVAKSCPTVSSEFCQEAAGAVRSLCVHYDPIDHDPIESLGYRGSEALIVFSHGCPNNVPRILFKGNQRHGWAPIFPGRGTASCQDAFELLDRESELRRKLANMNERRLAQSDWMTLYSNEAKKMILVLAALRRGPRQPEAISRKTGLSIPTINILIETATSWGWLNTNTLLTDTGQGQLKYARRIKREEWEVDKRSDELYFPKSLRAPLDAFSSR